MRPFGTLRTLTTIESMHLDGLIAPRYPRCQSYTEHAYIDYAKKGKEMRKAFIGTVVVMIALFVFSSLAFAQTAPSQNQANQARSPWKYYPKDVAVGDGGPAPKRDLSGTWAGPVDRLLRSRQEHRLRDLAAASWRKGNSRSRIRRSMRATVSSYASRSS